MSLLFIILLCSTGLIGAQKRSAPNEDPLAGLDLTALAELRELINSGGGGGLGGGSAALRRELAGSAGAGQEACGSPDSLTNLLVYQYLMGSLPGEDGRTSPSGKSTTSNAALQALLEESNQVSTRVTVSTSLTTSTVMLEPSTRFITSSTTYTTTVTSIDTKVIPVIFRGSKVTTTFSESTTEVIVATEYITSSTVLSPTIVQTLPVHITLTATSTKGFNGKFTLVDVVTGASSVLDEPIATATVDLDATGLLPSNIDLNNLDLSQLSQYDISSLTNAFGVSDSDQMVNALTALIQQYGAEPPKEISTRVSSKSSTRRRPGNRRRKQQFQDDIFVDPEEPPKFNVIKGFTLSDRPAQPRRNEPKRKTNSGGSAATATRYSKYHKKPEPENNGIGGSKRTSTRDRESERFSASVSRRTLSPQGRSVSSNRPKRNKKSPSSRFVAAQENKYYEDTSVNRNGGNGRRINRHIETATSRRKSSLTQDLKAEELKNFAQENKDDGQLVTLKRFTSRGRVHTSVEKIYPADKPLKAKTGHTTVLTMFVNGDSPGDFSKVLQTITLRGRPDRSKRHAVPEVSVSPYLNATEVHEKEFSTKHINELQNMKPHHVVKILKTLNKDVVRQMLKSLSKWVDFYTHELVDENNNNQNTIPDLQASISAPSDAVVSSRGTTSLPPLASSSNGVSCSPPQTVTETVYRTVLLTVT